MTTEKVPLGSEKGSAYGYWVTKPEGATKLLIFIHGHGERGNGSSVELDRVSRIGIQKLIYQGKWTRKEFIVISPQYPTTADKMYHTTLNTFILQMCAKYLISKDEVYLVGISGGANTLFNYLVNYSAKAAVLISGAGSYKLATQARDTKIWAVHGEDDTLIKYTNAKLFVDNYNKDLPAGKSKALFTLIPLYGHESGVWDKACANDKFYDWMIGP